MGYKILDLPLGLALQTKILVMSLKSSSLSHGFSDNSDLEYDKYKI